MVEWGAEPLTEVRHELGESPVWLAPERRLAWIDLTRPALATATLEGADLRVLPLDAPAPLGMIVACADPGTLVLAARDGLHWLDIATGARRPLGDPNEGRPDITYNDGKVDRAGRLWIGTSDARETEPRGILYRRAQNGRYAVADAGFAVSNGPAFSPDGNVAYFSDTVGRRILRYELSGDTLPFRGRTVFATFVPDEGMPDGLTVDAEGCLWCAHWGGARVTRFAPDGARIGRVRLPVPLVTACCFAGPALDALVITTARDTLDAAALAAAPHSGDVFHCRPGVRGLPETPFA